MISTIQIMTSPKSESERRFKIWQVVKEPGHPNMKLTNLYCDEIEIDACSLKSEDNIIVIGYVENAMTFISSYIESVSYDSTELDMSHIHIKDSIYKDVSRMKLIDLKKVKDEVNRGGRANDCSID